MATPYAIDDLRVKDISWVADATPTAEGQLGMNVATGRLRIFSDGAVRELGGRVLTGTPEGNLVGTITDLALDTAGGDLYFKASGSGNTGWTLLSTLAGNFAVLDAAQTFTKAQSVQEVVLFYATPNQPVDASLSNVFELTLTAATTQLDTPSNLVAGQTILFRIVQDGSGSRALTFSGDYDFATVGAPDLSTSAAGEMDLITCISDGTKLFCLVTRGFTA